jgi:hypothetical protein
VDHGERAPTVTRPVTIVIVPRGTLGRRGPWWRRWLTYLRFGRHVAGRRR